MALSLATTTSAPTEASNASNARISINLYLQSVAKPGIKGAQHFKVIYFSEAVFCITSRWLCVSLCSALPSPPDPILSYSQWYKREIHYLGLYFVLLLFNNSWEQLLLNEKFFT